MGLDIGGNTITQASSVLTINTGSATMNLLSAGGVVRPKQCQFQAIGNQSLTYVNMANDWNKMPFPTVITNVNGCYDTVNSRFTAPVAGLYFFQASCWLLKDGASDAYYWHPMFGVNGGVGTKTVNGLPSYRIRGHGWPQAGYEDSHVTQVYELAAGDFVEHYVYSTGSPVNRYHAPYQRFTGFLLG